MMDNFRYYAHKSENLLSCHCDRCSEKFYASVADGVEYVKVRCPVCGFEVESDFTKSELEKIGLTHDKVMMFVEWYNNKFPFGESLNRMSNRLAMSYYNMWEKEMITTKQPSL